MYDSSTTWCTATLQPGCGRNVFIHNSKNNHNIHVCWTGMKTSTSRCSINILLTLQVGLNCEYRNKVHIHLVSMSSARIRSPYDFTFRVFITSCLTYGYGCRLYNRQPDFLRHSNILSSVKVLMRGSPLGCHIASRPSDDLFYVPQTK